MREIKLTCIECPMGCDLTAVQKDGKITVNGNSCPRGELYANNEVICPKRVLTTTVKACNGKLVPVKTDAPIRKEMIFEIINKISKLTITTPVKIGDIVVENILDDANLIVTDNID